MLSRCTEPATYSGIRNRWPVRRRAGKPDNWDHRSGHGLPRPSKQFRPPKSPRLECASEFPPGLADSTRPKFGAGAVIGIDGAGGVPAGGRRQALLVARKAAVAGATAEITALDAVRG